MNSIELYNTLANLIKYSGKEIKEQHITADGATAVLNIDGEDIRIFVCPVVKLPCDIIEMDYAD